MILRRITEHVTAHNWFAVAIDFIIVVVGVFVGVQADNWWASQSDARREAAYLRALTEDFSQIIAEIEDDARNYETIAGAMVTLLDQSRSDPPDMSALELNKSFSFVLHMIGTSIVTDTYSNLTGSGDLRLLRNQELKNALAAFYSRAEIIRLVGNTHELQLVEIFQPYIVENLDYLAVFESDRKTFLPAAIKASLPAAFEQDRILGVLPSAQFRNVVAIKFDTVTDLIDVLAESLADAREIDALLDQELEKRS